MAEKDDHVDKSSFSRYSSATLEQELSNCLVGYLEE